jgi:tRNA-splicing ligase RtcB
VIACFAEFVGGPVEQRDRVQCHHNYTERETHYGEQVWLSRKGAINAARGVPGLIPGSMGDASYVVVGKGNPASLNSSPHGAGRAYSRTAARKAFTREQLREAMKGIEFRDTDAFLDEIPQAYKPIDVVMRDAEELVSVRHTLRQMVNVKGD